MRLLDCSTALFLVTRLIFRPPNKRHENFLGRRLSCSAPLARSFAICGSIDRSIDRACLWFDILILFSRAATHPSLSMTLSPKRYIVLNDEKDRGGDQEPPPKQQQQQKRLRHQTTIPSITSHTQHIKLKSVLTGLKHSSRCDGCSNALCISTHRLMGKIRQHQHRLTDQEKSCKVCQLWLRIIALHHIECHEEVCNVPACVKNMA